MAFQTVERGGTILIFSGASEKATIPVAINDIFWRTEVTLTSSYAGAPYDCATALKLIGAGSVPVEKSITHKMSLEEGPEGFKMVCAPVEHDCIKIVIEPHK